MIINNHKNQEKNGNEIIIVHSLRAKILDYLSKVESARFKDITITLEKHDFVINRELKTLVKRGWVIKTGSSYKTKYALDPKSKGVREFLIKLKSTPDADAVYYPIKMDLEKKKSSLDVFINNVEKYQDDINQKIKLTTATLSFSHLEVTVAGEKIDGFSELVHVPNEVAIFIREIATARAIAKTASIRKDNFTAGDDESNKIFAETYDQEFKVIISWKPAKEPLAYLNLKNTLLEKALQQVHEDLHKKEDVV